MTLLDPLKDRLSICTTTPIFRTLLVNLQVVRRLLVFDVPLNTWTPTREQVTLRAWPEQWVPSSRVRFTIHVIQHHDRVVHAGNGAGKQLRWCEGGGEWHGEGVGYMIKWARHSVTSNVPIKQGFNTYCKNVFRTAR